MSFDVEAARKAGYSDQEIAGYLSEQSGFDMKGALNSGYSHAEVLDFLSRNERPKAAVGEKAVSPAEKSAQDDYVSMFAAPTYIDSPYEKKRKQGMSWGEVGKQALGNAIPSALNAGGDLLNAVLHPIDTLTVLGKVGLGAAQKLIPGEQESEKYADAVGEHFAQRYGGMENFKRTVAADPVGVLGDISSLFTGGAGLGKAAASAASTGSKAVRAAGLAQAAQGMSGAADVLNKVANAASVAGRATDPIFGTAELAGKIAAPRLYQSALMPSTRLTPAERDRVVQAGLREGILPTKGGYEKAEELVRGLNDDVTRLIDDATDAGNTIDPLRVANNALDNTFDRFRHQATPTGDLEAIARDVGDFVDSWGGAPLTPKEAQKIKTGTYRELKEKDFRPGEPTSASKATQRALASELRQEIENIVPDVKNLNRREGDLIALMDQIEPNIGRHGNWRIFSLPAALGGSLYGMTSGDWLTAILGGLGISQWRSPWLKGRLAIHGHTGNIPRWLHNLGAYNYAGGNTLNLTEQN